MVRPTPDNYDDVAFYTKTHSMHGVLYFPVFIHCVESTVSDGAVREDFKK